MIFYLRTLGHPSLWLDEAWEANYYLGIVPAPWYNRPVLYMLAEQLVAKGLGPGEFALRLLPCLAGLATIAATWQLVRRTMGEASAWLAAGLLAIAPTFLYESHQLKHYTFDALFTVLLLIAYQRYRDDPSVRRLAIYALIGLVSFGFSFTSIFVLAAIGLVHASGSALEAWRTKPREPSRSVENGKSSARAMFGVGKAFTLFAGVNVALVAAFMAIYAAFHASAQGDTLLKDYFAEAWPPLGQPLALPGWLARQSRVLGEIAGASSFVAFGLVLLAGVWSELGTRGSDSSPGTASATRSGDSPRPASPSGLLTPTTLGCLLVLLIASAAHLYPYGSARLTLFMAPLVCALASAGMLEALGLTSRERARSSLGHEREGSRLPAEPLRWARFVAVAGLLYVLMYPALSGARPYLTRGWGTDELGRNIAVLATVHQRGEGIYVPERASASFTYYWWRAGKGTDANDVVQGERHRLHPQDHAAQIAHLAVSYPVLWVIWNDQSREERETLRGFLLERFSSIRREGAREAESLELFKGRAASTTSAWRPGDPASDRDAIPVESQGISTYK